MSIKAEVSIHKRAILPYLTYCSLVGHFCNGSDKRKLERVNGCGLPAIFCDSRTSCIELLSPYTYDTYEKSHFSESPFSYNLRNSEFCRFRFNPLSPEGNGKFF